MSESWIQIISLFLANAGLIIWFRTESRSDWRHMDNKMDKYREETQSIIRSIDKEIKDFHSRLIEIEIKHRSS
jgi:hypothetical protein